VMIAGAGE